MSEENIYCPKHGKKIIMAAVDVTEAICIAEEDFIPMNDIELKEMCRICVGDMVHNMLTKMGLYCGVTRMTSGYAHDPDVNYVTDCGYPFRHNMDDNRFCPKCGRPTIMTGGE